MTLREFVSGLTTEQRREFCKRAQTSTAYVSQVAGGHRRIGSESARQWVVASQALFPDDMDRWLSLGELRPDLWGEDAA